MADHKVQITLTAHDKTGAPLKQAQRQIEAVTESAENQAKRRSSVVAAAWEKYNATLAGGTGEPLRSPTLVSKMDIDGTNALSQSLAAYQEQADRANQTSTALAGSQRNLAQATDDTTNSTDGLFTTFTAANLAAEGIMRAFGFVRTQMQESRQAALAYNTAMTGLETVTSSYGESASAARLEAEALSADGILPITSSAKGLQSLMQGGLGLGAPRAAIVLIRSALAQHHGQRFGPQVDLQVPVVVVGLAADGHHQVGLEDAPRTSGCDVGAPRLGLDLHPGQSVGAGAGGFDHLHMDVGDHQGVREKGKRWLVQAPPWIARRSGQAISGLIYR